MYYIRRTGVARKTNPFEKPEGFLHEKDFAWHEVTWAVELDLLPVPRERRLGVATSDLIRTQHKVKRGVKGGAAGFRVRLHGRVLGVAHILSVNLC